MKKIIICLLAAGLVWLPSFSQAQGSVWKKRLSFYKTAEIKPAGFKRSRVLQEKQLDKILKARAEASQKNIYKKANQQDLKILLDELEMPVVGVKNWSDDMSFFFYKMHPALKNASNKAFKNYALAFHNRLAAGTVQRRKKIQADMQAYTQQLIEQSVSFKPEEFAQRAAEKVPPGVKQILIGEEHDVPEVSAYILDFIKAVYARNPNRRIIYFTEFVSQDVAFASMLPMLRFSGKDAAYYRIYDWVYKHSFAAHGLENPAVSLSNDVELLFKQEDGTVQAHSLWQSLSGIYLRNTSWLQLLMRYRKKYPDALFIIHTGAWHSGYIMPFSLAQAFNPQETFVAHFMRKDCTLINEFTHGLVNAPVLGWTDKKLARIAGFDVQILTDWKGSAK